MYTKMDNKVADNDTNAETANTGFNTKSAPNISKKNCGTTTHEANRRLQSLQTNVAAATSGYASNSMLMKYRHRMTSRHNQLLWSQTPPSGDGTTE